MSDTRPDISTVKHLDLDSLNKSSHYLEGDKTIVRVGNKDSSPLAANINNPSELFQGNILAGLVFDAISFEYPDPITEIYKFYKNGLSGDLQSILTITYVDKSKEYITAVERNDI